MYSHANCLVIYTISRGLYSTYSMAIVVPIGGYLNRRIKYIVAIVAVVVRIALTGGLD